MKVTVVTCPVDPDVREIARLSGDLAAAFRRLRRSLKRCDTCKAAGGCPLISQFKAETRAALEEVREELSIAGF